MAIADSVSVMPLGRTVADLDLAETTMDELAELTLLRRQNRAVEACSTPIKELKASRVERLRSSAEADRVAGQAARFVGQGPNATWPRCPGCAIDHGSGMGQANEPFLVPGLIAELPAGEFNVGDLHRFPGSLKWRSTPVQCAHSNTALDVRSGPMSAIRLSGRPKCPAKSSRKRARCSPEIDGSTI